MPEQKEYSLLDIRDIDQFNFFAKRIGGIGENYSKKPPLSDKDRDIIKERIETFLASLNPAERASFLEKSLRKRIVDFAQNALEVLSSDEAESAYRPEPTDREEIVDIILWIKAFDKALGGSAFSVEFGDIDPGFFPYRGFDIRDNLELATLIQNIGHDIGHLPGFSSLAFQYEYVKNHFLYDVLSLDEFFPFARQGLIWYFEAVKSMAENRFALSSGVVLTGVLETIAKEMFFRDANKKFCSYQGEVVLKEKDSDKSKLDISTDIEPELVLTGNAGALHLVFYQLVKNSRKFLERSQSVDGQIKIKARRCSIKKQELLAVSFEDNGPGVDLMGVLKSKAELAAKVPDSLGIREKLVLGDWSYLDLKIIEVLNFIFERRVSGKGLKGSGLGLAMVKDLMDQHGGAVWVTNFLKKDGCKFLFVFDPSADGSLRRNLPELFSTENVPAEDLEEIDKQLNNPAKPLV